MSANYDQEAIVRLERAVKAAHPNHKTMCVYIDDLRAALAAFRAADEIEHLQAALREIRDYVETSPIMLVGWGMALERERCISVVIDAANAGKYTPLSELASAIRGDETEREAME
ncbi:hypothetical protein CN204_04445 [Sinorhizobium meliloti]|uniref:hypothetical protein n=1 Tax=Rhizobium meliloti TaxID=382 RepID=UPI000FDB0B85|nr:hypothetical protein [Sinorhizobium meliloti]RVH87784.1 hypothetical protein CN204_04445 [Sinorhizobium meliloti]